MIIIIWAGHVELLIMTERMLAEQREHRLSQQDEVLTWRLRAEVAEAYLDRTQTLHKD